MAILAILAWHDVNVPDWVQYSIMGILTIVPIVAFLAHRNSSEPDDYSPELPVENQEKFNEMIQLLEQICDGDSSDEIIWWISITVCCGAIGGGWFFGSIWGRTESGVNYSC
jgi:hypothetical protein